MKKNKNRGKDWEKKLKKWIISENIIRNNSFFQTHSLEIVFKELPFSREILWGFFAKKWFWVKKFRTISRDKVPSLNNNWKQKMKEKNDKTWKIRKGRRKTKKSNNWKRNAVCLLNKEKEQKRKKRAN